MKWKHYHKLPLLNSVVLSLQNLQHYLVQISFQSLFDKRKFGAIGWSTKYNFNEFDLQIYADVLNNFPQEDLRYLYGEIMYGRHIIDNQDK